jgi:lysyl-tRNA synthetase, class II
MTTKNSDINNSTSSVQAQREVRLQRMQKLQELGQDPFTPDSHRDFVLAKVKHEFELFKSHSSLTLAGRIKRKRTSGKIAFATVEDESYPDGFQFIFKQDVLDVESNSGLKFDDFKQLLDEGDYIQATGYLDVSQSGEPSLFVTKYKILTKALRPLPDELDYQNVENRYLDRVADFKMNTKDESGLGVRDMLSLKSNYWSIWREEMINEGFLEVETPSLELIPGGAEAKPFQTYYNELEQEVYLRIAPELNLKKLMAGGFEAVFEIGKNFRNEGSSPQHLQEYTAIEWYKAYQNYNYGMELTKRIYQRIAKEVLGDTRQVDYYGNTINWGDWCSSQEAEQNGWENLSGWPKIKYFDAVRYFSDGQTDTEGKTDEELVEIGKKLGIEGLNPHLGTGTLLDKIWKKVRVNTKNPFFLILPPVELEPLAKRHPQNPSLTERFQVVAGSAELGKGFSELNDPVDQFDRFEVQQAARDAGNDEAQFMDPGYVRALEYGTPPMAGFGTSERFFSFLLGKHIKECVTFPAVKPQEQNAKKTKTMVAHCLILDEPGLESWRKFNTVSHLTAAFGARAGQRLFWHKDSESKDGENILMNIQHAIINKKTDSSDKIHALKLVAESKGLEVAVFTQDMQNSSDDAKVSLAHSQQTADQIKWLGVLIFGKKSDVEELTQDFELVS